MTITQLQHTLKVAENVTIRAVRHPVINPAHQMYVPPVKALSDYTYTQMVVWLTRRDRKRARRRKHA